MKLCKLYSGPTPHPSRHCISRSVFVKLPGTTFAVDPWQPRLASLNCTTVYTPLLASAYH